jgi:hypothetical protein
MKPFKKNHFYFFWLIALLQACATPGAPTGGPLDKTPPKVMTFSPGHLSTNVQDKTFTVQFDEWVQIANVREQVIISPAPEKFPEIIAKRDQVTVRFEDDLKDSTTYSIYFGSAIKDLKEGNPADNILYVFSTGTDIDSLEISGQVKLPSGQTLPENTYAMIYDVLDDSIVVREKPRNAFMLGKEPNFKLQYLPTGEYKLIALSDKNNNLLYDLPTEWIGVYPVNIQLDSNIKNIQLPILLPEDENYSIKEFNTVLDNGVLNIRWNKVYSPLKDSFSVQILVPGTSTKKHSYQTADRTSFFIQSDSNSMGCVLYYGSNIIDTIRVRRDSKVPQNFILRTIPQAAGKYSNLSLFKNQSVLVESNIPLLSVQQEKISITDTSGQAVPFAIKQMSEKWQFELLPEITTGQDYQWVLSDSALQFLNGQYSTQQKFLLSQAPDNLFGQLVFNVQLPSIDTSYVVSIKTAKGNIIHEAYVFGDSVYRYTSTPLMAGSYVVEVVEDLNQSGTWNGGSYWKKRLPESVFRSESVNVKENWEQEIKVKVDFSNPVLPLPLPEPETDTPKTDKAAGEATSTQNQERRSLFDK